ncbi:MAG: hydrogenase maturation protease [Chloroflexi bacterium]|nr:hydrogenase maturation protease [Chloroflexota bacterium]
MTVQDGLQGSGHFHNCPAVEYNVGPFANAYWGHPAYKLPPAANLMAVAHYLEALDWQRNVIRAHALLGAKNPHLQTYLVDAAETGREAGTMIRLENEQVPAFMSMKISPHQMGVPDMLAAARMKDIYPARIVMWGIQPERITLDLELSPLLASKVDLLVEKLVEELRAWGYEI